MEAEERLGIGVVVHFRMVHLGGRFIAVEYLPGPANRLGTGPHRSAIYLSKGLIVPALGRRELWRL